MNLSSQADSSFAGCLLGAGTISKDGIGTLTLTGDSSQYNGCLVLDAGMLVVSEGGS